MASKIRTIIIIIIVLMMVGCNSIENPEKQNLNLFEKKGLYGYKTTDGETVIPAKYILAHEFSEHGIAPVLDVEKGWIYINKSQQVVIKPYEVNNGYDEFSDGLARFKKEDKIGFFNKKGEVVIPDKFEYATKFIRGIAAVAKDLEIKKDGELRLPVGGKWGFINKSGKLIVQYKFDNVIFPFNEEGKAVVVYNGKKVYVNRNGEVLESYK